METIELCSLCDRELSNQKSRHHLTPQMYGGKDIINLHKMCHDKIHTVFTEKELKNEFNTMDKIRQNEEIIKFIKWVSKKQPDFYDNSNHTKIRRQQFKYRKG